MFDYEDLSDHPFSPENVAYESGRPSAGEAQWLRFVRDVEKLLGMTRKFETSSPLDGDQDEDGHSLDTAHDYFEKGESASSYADFVRSERKRLGLSLVNWSGR